ncbi:ABC transporter ATP-binding protein [Streptomyces sp. WMMC500]|uniref:ABC transporter ATP-binding protein n=1 Tax=Streptomyces sp. WMMC500 TaxID=3015154 RepID=UPI00248D1CEE|nr:ABC transporter ATP-binding protein [Streptomyces sp. WMMC500]WBB58434.1 ABC transporter ATP-binding protein [Streptomyces sp. WMMC500]
MSLSDADRLLAHTVRRAWGWNTLLLLAELVGAGGALLLPALLAAAVDERLTGSGTGATYALAGLAALLALSEAAVVLLTPWCTATATLHLRRGMLSHLLSLGVNDRDAHSHGDLTTRLLTNAAETASAVPLLGSWLSSLLVSGGALVALGLIEIRLALIFLAGLPVAAVLIGAFVRRISPLLTDYLAVQGRISGRLLEVLTGIRTVRAAGTERREAGRILADMPELHRIGRESWRLQGRMNAHTTLVMAAMQVAVLGAAGHALIGDRITPGQLVASVTYTGMALGLLRQADAFMALARARAGARRLAGPAALPPLRQGDRDLPEGPGTLTLRSVTVHGPGGPLLQDVDLTVPGGSTVAVVGRSGAGKSTLAAVAGRLIEPDRGDVTLDGVPLAELSASALRAAVGWAFERPTFLGASLREAIGFGTPGLTDGQIRDAAAAARADAFIRRLPAGYDTPAGRAPLSGGELQRIGLARALAHGGRLLVLDDATSSLDTVTEMQITEVLNGALGHTTQLVLAHRISTAAHADLVAWVDEGCVRGLAPHGELWHDPDYQALFRPVNQRERRLSHAR